MAEGQNDPEAMPRRVGSFDLIEEIGRGGMGVVYRARDLELERYVALKRPNSKHLAKPGFRRTFFAEARAASKLMHPNIVAIFEVFEDNGVPWMAMELIDGASLRSMVAGNRRLPIRDALHYLEGLTDALRAAHLSNILHRDVNPNNILVGRDGRARLTDFGLAQALNAVEVDQDLSQCATDSGSLLHVAGTRGYMAPEQALGATLDARSDIFSLGLVFYEMCTGQPAFAEHDSGNWLDALLNREPRDMSDINAEVPPEVEAIVRKAIAKRPFQRYQSANEMLLDVSAARRKYDSASGPIVQGVSRGGGVKRSRWLVYGVVVALVAAVVGLSAWVADRYVRTSTDWRPRQISASPGWEGQPAISPDGTMIAYASDESGSLDIWVADVQGGGTLRLTDHPGVDEDPSWFPDGSAIVYASDRGGTSSIWKVPRLGGVPVMLLENAAQPAISPDGKNIAFVTPRRFCKLRVAIAPLDHPTDVHVLTAENQGYWDHENPTWSPDGRTICFSDFRDLYLIPSDGTDGPIRLTTDDAIDRNPVWSLDGRWIYFSSGREGTTALWRMHPTVGAVAERLTLGTGPESEPSVTRDGRWLAYSTFAENSDIALVDRSSGESTLISGDRVEDCPALAPDGSHIVFVSNRSATFDLWQQELQGIKLVGVPVRITDLAGDEATPAYSRDGRWLTFFRVFEQQRDIWTLNSGGGVPHQITEDPAFDIHPSFSPDGSRIVFVSQRGGEQGLWLIPVAEGRRAGDAVRLQAPGAECAVFPRWSPDGERIAYISDNEAWVLDVDEPAAARAVTDGARAMNVAWEPGGDALLVSGTWGLERVELRRVIPSTGESVSLDPPIYFGAADVFGLFDVTADGSTIAHLTGTTKGNIWVAELGEGSR